MDTSKVSTLISVSRLVLREPAPESPPPARLAARAGGLPLSPGRNTRDTTALQSTFTAYRSVPRTGTRTPYLTLGSVVGGVL